MMAGKYSFMYDKKKKNKKEKKKEKKKSTHFKPKMVMYSKLGKPSPLPKITAKYKKYEEVLKKKK
jgi:hypothetical protein